MPVWAWMTKEASVLSLLSQSVSSKVLFSVVGRVVSSFSL